MNLSNRSKLSLFLSEMPEVDCETLCQKHTLNMHPPGSPGRRLESVKKAILQGTDDQIGGILEEVLRTSQSIRSNISPKYRFDERWRELRRYLELDGYRVENDGLGDKPPSFVPLDSSIPELIEVHDDLEIELKKSQLAEAQKVIEFLKQSALEFVNSDFNGCLNKARLALETLGKSIAVAKDGHATNDLTWGKAATAMRQSKFINKDQEKGLTSVYTFVSPGSHEPLGLSEIKFARLGGVVKMVIWGVNW